jgi:hypothetical protein
LPLDNFDKCLLQCPDIRSNEDLVLDQYK